MVLIKPWGTEMFPPQNPYDMINAIGGYYSTVGCLDNRPLPSLVVPKSNLYPHLNSNGNGLNNAISSNDLLNGNAEAYCLDVVQSSFPSIGGGLDNGGTKRFVIFNVFAYVVLGSSF